jgi:glycosyltransferase involved in cell wall biosynthesis
MMKESSVPKQFQNRAKILAAIPCFNEERCIGSVVLKTKSFADSVLVIDDGSTDATAEIATQAGATVYQHGQNRGYGVAIHSALQKGRQLGAEVLVILDGDGQHDPKDIPKLVKPILDGEAEVAISDIK